MISHQSAPLTSAQIYDENALAYLRNGASAEIAPTSPSWGSWKAYFQAINHKTMLIVMGAHEDRTWLSKHGATVPTEWPDQFDETAPRLPPARDEPEYFLSPEARANVVRKALLDTGFTPKEHRRSRPVAAHELKGVQREQREKEVRALLEHARHVAEQPMPALSDSAMALFHRGNEPGTSA